ncbi:MAG: sugar phosphate isomerase/epimerase [Rhodospirillales bacterium]|nr:sugar phosphate isomerase/epimerase [Rhodospirillales bacterium]
MQQLNVFQSIWAMERRHPDGKEWSVEQIVNMVAEAGYDGMDLLTFRPDQSREAHKLLGQLNLDCTCCAFPKSVAGFQDDIDLAMELGAIHLNVIGQVYPYTVEEGADVVRAWMEMAQRAGIVMTIETHRDCITTDMLYTLQLMEAVPDMLMCADLSHYVVGREFGWPIDDWTHGLIRQILGRSKAFQGRVASREQIQIQTSFPHHHEWFDLFAGWWEEGFRLWRARESESAVLNFLCELGPKEYAITGPDGCELSDRWEEALVIKQRVRDIWKKLDQEP